MVLVVNGLVELTPRDLAANHDRLDLPPASIGDLVQRDRDQHGSSGGQCPSRTAPPIHRGQIRTVLDLLPASYFQKLWTAATT